MFEESLETAVAQEQIPPTDPVQQVPVESPADRNWKAMRERAEQAERRAQELERSIAQQQQPKQEEEDFNFGVDDDGLTEGKHLKKAYKSLKDDLKQTKKQLEQFNNMSAEMRLRSKFSDFDAVMTPENMKQLAIMKPAIARSIAANNDLYDQGETAYDAIRAFVKSESFESTDKRIEENKQKPRSVASIAPQTAETPLTKVADYDRRVLTEERKEQLRRQVAEARMHRT